MSLVFGSTSAPTCPGLPYQILEASAPLQNVLQHVETTSPFIANVAAYTHAFTSVQAVKTAADPESVEQAFEKFSSIYTVAKTPNLFEAVGKIISLGLSTIGLDDIKQYIAELANNAASHSNTNLKEPDNIIYPRAHSQDAPYSFPEDTLRGAIHIPTTFRYGAEGAPQPIILVGGTGNPGYVSFAGSYIPLLQDSATSFGDPVWLNMPGHALLDVQANAEFVAYAVNYIHGISRGRPVAVVGYSQGNLDAQWAYKYWPSTRGLVSDHVALSPGYHGTQLTEILGLVPQPPAWLQATYDSAFVAALRAGGGDSAFVPTTVVYSATDQVVQPQRGPGASSPLADAWGVGVSNNLIQDVCPGWPAGGFYTHEGMLVNPLAYALAKDALAHEGPGRVERLDLEAICRNYLAPGLRLEDFLVTENNVVFAGVATLLYSGKSRSEPRIRVYAA
ncbi:hypothetical protein F5B20DRAFT_539846 [Whalleya microplaca]|nr:hypothetical protein F5B20DRAFT_539846 [Whalleya microplaca]